LSVPLALTRPGIVRVAMDSVGINHQPGDLRFLVNGQEMDGTLDTTSSQVIFQGTFGADPGNLASCELQILVKQHFTPEGDPRTLGVMIAFIEFELPLAG
jgi:hypothetical protein